MQITGKEGSLSFAYKENGRLCIIDWTDMDVNDATVARVLTTIPLHERLVNDFGKTDKVKITKQPEDLSFERFWNLYAYKVGKIDRCKKLWSALTDAEKSLNLRQIPKYNNWLSGKSIDKAYPSTWLSERRWENEYN